MKLLADYFRQWARAWDQFWFTPADPATLCLVRALAGAMLFYTHLVWSLDLLDFFGPGGWLPQFPISHFYLFSSPTLIWIAHLAALAVFFCLMIGFHARTASVLAALLTLSYINQVPMATFGLDQINAMLAVYLVIGPAGPGCRLTIGALDAPSRAKRRATPARA